MSGPCLSSSVAGRPLRPATRHSLGKPLPYQLADRPRAHQETSGCPDFSFRKMPSLATCGINLPFGKLSPISRQIAHVLRTLAPLNILGIATKHVSFDLHVLSTPPAFVLSQNQTLREKFAPMPLKHQQIPTFIVIARSQSAEAVSRCGVCMIVLLIFEIKDLTYNAQFNFCCH